MKLAIMQPYFFPYLGYFQLIESADTFVFYDDVAFIKQGWINRNRILVDGVPLYFTVPLAKASSFVPINKTRIHRPLFTRWKRKFLRTLQHSYGNLRYFAPVFDLVQDILAGEARDIARLAIRSIERCSEYLGIRTDFRISSRDYPPSGRHGVRRILEICRECRAGVYLNLPGGRRLYRQADFDGSGDTALAFLSPELKSYPQRSEQFVPGLSILDLMMCCSVERVQSHLQHYTIECD